MPVNPESFTSAMSRVASPVAIVTTVDEAGTRWGFTASSFCSVSLHPPLILVCLAETATCHRAFVAARRFIVNVLGEQHAGLARRFARSGQDKFTGSAMTDCELGLPGLADAVTRLACTRHAVLPGGDHSILIGRVDDAVVVDQPPLIYHNRLFNRPDPLAPANGRQKFGPLGTGHPPVGGNR